MRGTIFLTAALLGSLSVSSASVTVQGWWHLDSTQPITDSSGNNRTFGSAYSTAPATGGQVAAQVINNGAGGPLDGTGYTSTQCILVGVGVGGKRQSSMWGLGYNPPAQNYGIEIWVLPQDNGIAGGSGGWILSSGQSGGVALRINQPTGGAESYIDAFNLGTSTTIGNQVPIDTNNWMHLAIVNAGGVTTFYTNGVACGASNTNGATASAGDAYCISAPGDNQAFYGYLDEARMFTFAAGAFSTNDLLLRPAGPQIIAQPQSASVWLGGAATFSVTPSFSGNIGYQWRSNGTNVQGAIGQHRHHVRLQADLRQSLGNHRGGDPHRRFAQSLGCQRLSQPRNERTEPRGLLSGGCGYRDDCNQYRQRTLQWRAGTQCHLRRENK